MENYDTIQDIIEAHERVGGHFFEKSSMQFFNSRINAEVYAGRIFVTSESDAHSLRRVYTVRAINERGHIDTLSRDHLTRYSAHAVAKEYAKKS